MELRRIILKNLSLREVAQFLGISESHVYKLSQSGELPAYKIGKLWRWDKGILETWIKAKIMQQSKLDVDADKTETKHSNAQEKKKTTNS